MYYNTRRGSKVVPVEPFVIMINQSSLYGVTGSDADNLFLVKTGLEAIGGARYQDKIVPQSINLTVVHNFTRTQVVTVDPCGIRSTVGVENLTKVGSGFGARGGQLDDFIKLKLMEQCERNQRTLEDHIAIFKYVCITASSHEEVRMQVEYTGFNNSIKQAILSCEPKKVYKGANHASAYEFMLVYLVSADAFADAHTVIEPQTQVCITKLNIHSAYGHPLDLRASVMDVSALVDVEDRIQPHYMNAELVYHVNKLQDRYININGRVVRLPQVQDSTRPEGFHLTDFHIVENYRGMEHNKHYVPLAQLTESNGFYKTAELARSRKTTEQAERANSMLANAIDLVKSHKTESVKDLDGFAKAAIDKMVLLTERSLGENRAYVEKKQQEYKDNVLQTTKTIEKLQEELRDNKRTHETAMQTRKEVLETIRLVPPLLGCIAAIMAFRKKNQQ